MAKKKKIPDSYQIWIDARKRYHLSHAHIQMARELGMNPKEVRQEGELQARTLEGAAPNLYRKALFRDLGSALDI